MPTPRKDFIRSTVLAITTFCVGLNVYFDLFADGSFARRLLQNLGDRNRFSALQSIDHLYAALPPSENVFLQFENLEGAVPLVEQIYYRSCYTAYPRKVYVDAPDAVLNHGEEILHAQLTPDAGWLDRHRVGRIINFRRNEEGRVDFQAEDRQPR